MSRYLVSVEKYFSGEELFEEEGNSKQEAVEKVKKRLSYCGGGNYKLETAKCKKKIKK